MAIAMNASTTWQRVTFFSMAWLCAVGMRWVLTSAGNESAPVPDHFGLLPPIAKEVAQARAKATQPSPVQKLGLVEVTQLLPPITAGITQWSVDDAARYERQESQPGPYRKALNVEVSVLRQAEATDEYFSSVGAEFRDQSWILMKGLEQFRSVMVDVIQMATPSDMAPSLETPGYGWGYNYFPLLRLAPFFDLGLCNLSDPETRPVPSEYEEFGIVGECRFISIEIPGKGWAADVWIHPLARPLGILQLKSPSEVLKYRGAPADRMPELQRFQADLIEGRSTFVLSCASCHESTFGGGPLVVPPR